jgi:hypothetical protein
MTMKEYLIEEINRQLRKEGRDIELVAERPGPRLVAEGGEVVQLSAPNSMTLIGDQQKKEL